MSADTISGPESIHDMRSTVIPFRYPLPDEILVHIGTILARDGHSATLASLLSTSTETYDLLLRILYRTMFVTDRTAAFFRDLVNEALRRDPTITFGTPETTVLSIPFGFDKALSDAISVPTYRTSTLARADLVHALIIEPSLAAATYRRCTKSWFVPPSRPTSWPALFPSLEIISFPSEVLRCTAERFEGVPLPISPNYPQPFLKWMEWRAPFEALCEGLRLLSPSKTRLCLHVSLVKTTEQVPRERADVIRDGQVQSVGIALHTFAGLDGCNTVVYEGITPSETWEADSPVVFDLLALVKSLMRGCGKRQILLRDAGIPEYTATPTHQHPPEVEEQKNFDVDDPPAGLPNGIAIALWKAARARSKKAPDGPPGRNEWQLDRFAWQHLYQILRYHVVLLRPTDDDSETILCTYCKGDW